MEPPFEITHSILNLSSDITRFLGQYEGLKLPRPQPMLIRKNRIKTIQSSLEIEGNRLTEDQVTAILDNKRVIGPAKDILEVKNTIKAYENLSQYKPNQLSSLLTTHSTLMKNLVPEAGQLRSTNVGIMKGGGVSHIAPKYTFVPKLMGDLFSFLKTNKEVSPLIKSCVFHYEFEFIHPFTDGNGRTGRLWQTTILSHYHPIFEFVPVESIIKKRRELYYNALETSDKKGNSTAFIHFMLESIKESLRDFLSDLKPVPETQTSRIQKAKTHFNKKIFSRKSYLEFHKTISTATASRDLAFATQKNLLKKTGTQALTHYQFI